MSGLGELENAIAGLKRAADANAADRYPRKSSANRNACSSGAGNSACPFWLVDAGGVGACVHRDIIESGAQPYLPDGSPNPNLENWKEIATRSPVSNRLVRGGIDADRGRTRDRSRSVVGSVHLAANPRGHIGDALSWCVLLACSAIVLAVTLL